MPLRQKALHVTGGLGIFPLFLDAGPDAWGRHMLTRRLEREGDAFEALTLCPLDGVGNIALGEITAEREPCFVHAIEEWRIRGLPCC